MKFSSALKGFLIVGFILHHLSEEFTQMVILSPFRRVGLPIGVIYFFLSGYEILNFDPDRVGADFYNRMRGRGRGQLLFALSSLGILISLNFLFKHYFSGISVSFRALGGDLLRGGSHLLFPFSWYPLSFLFLHLCFHFVFITLKKDLKGGIFLFLLILSFSMVLSKGGKFPFGWYGNISSLSFLFGILWRIKEESLLRHLNGKRGAVLLFSSLVILYCGGQHLLSLLLFPIIVVLPCYFLPLPSLPLFRFLGDLSAEIFLVQALAVVVIKESLSFSLPPYSLPLLSGGAIFALVLLLAHLKNS
ncbi:MAG: hypothetical protein PQJ60_08225, partial [Spirochaetales bacterium]|nr:hypothetical protein [Spirochaetales bacterium]